MMLSLPSFFAAAINADMPPTSAADFAAAASTVEAVPPPQAVNRTRAPARRPSRLIAASLFIALPPSSWPRWPGTCAAEDKRVPCSPPPCRLYVPPFKHLRDRMSRKEGLVPGPRRHRDDLIVQAARPLRKQIRRGRQALGRYSGPEQVGAVGGVAIVDLNEREDEAVSH